MTKLTTSIKKVDGETWRLFKVEAAKHGMQLGEFFSRIVNDHKDHEIESNWDAILTGKSILSKKQAEGIKKQAKQFRKGFDFR